ncbi:hypothetical protein [Calothrix sp. 336/3]|uniref:hypothetical protein n=1 Tax=Calothrix sp. 336/3 TaxID=1337936 RepID=UPI0004E307DE|nr:hypothetical protein [Calothrix sp. 336/3]AKG20585.1 hypothetical protein IJ00_03965 [Calothrix sp. 336/3]
MTPGLEKIKQVFEQKYATFGITLEIENLRLGEVGEIDEDNGFFITYKYDIEDGEEYLDLFVSHRMTNDTLRRIYGDGREELLGCVMEFYVAKNEESKQAYYAHNRQFYDLVKSKGLSQ